jgi:polyphenol oxidase
MHNLIQLPRIQTFLASDENELLTLQRQLSLPLVRMAQVHGDQIAVIRQTPPASTLENVDATLTDLPDLILTVRAADCLPILIAHPSGVIGVVHAGRRGTQAEILAKTLQTLHQTWKITDNVHIWVGPHICAQCYEINPQTHERYDLLTENLKQIHQVFDDYAVNITVDERCTLEDATLHSYRREGKGCPHQVAGIWLDSLENNLN